MRALLPATILLAASLFAPLAGAESRSHEGTGAGGATIGLRSGVTGAQADDHTGVGLRYWQNATVGQGVSVQVTVCLLMDNGAGSCRPWRLQA